MQADSAPGSDRIGAASAVRVRVFQRPNVVIWTGHILFGFPAAFMFERREDPDCG